VFVKVSEVLRKVDGRVPGQLEFYRSTLDELWDMFGPDRLLYGSDWPNSDLWAPYPNVLKIVSAYFNGKGRADAGKVFCKTSRTAYRWISRDSSQSPHGIDGGSL
jgi:predicted TIM-barrel fold metal-dependent hydrolase